MNYKTDWVKGTNEAPVKSFYKPRAGYWKTNKNSFNSFDEYLQSATSFVSKNFLFKCYEFKNHYAIRVKRGEDKMDDKERIEYAKSKLRNNSICQIYEKIYKKSKNE